MTLSLQTSVLGSKDPLVNPFCSPTAWRPHTLLASCRGIVNHLSSAPYLPHPLPPSFLASTSSVSAGKDEARPQDTLIATRHTSNAFRWEEREGVKGWGGVRPMMNRSKTRPPKQQEKQNASKTMAGSVGGPNREGSCRRRYMTLKWQADQYWTVHGLLSGHWSGSKPYKAIF